MDYKKFFSLTRPKIILTSLLFILYWGVWILYDGKMCMLIQKVCRQPSGNGYDAWSVPFSCTQFCSVGEFFAEFKYAIPFLLISIVISYIISCLIITLKDSYYNYNK